MALKVKVADIYKQYKISHKTNEPNARQLVVFAKSIGRPITFKDANIYLTKSKKKGTKSNTNSFFKKESTLSLKPISNPTRKGSLEISTSTTSDAGSPNRIGPPALEIQSDEEIERLKHSNKKMAKELSKLRKEVELQNIEISKLKKENNDLKSIESEYNQLKMDFNKVQRSSIGSPQQLESKLHTTTAENQKLKKEVEKLKYALSMLELNKHIKKDVSHNGAMSPRSASSSESESESEEENLPKSVKQTSVNTNVKVDNVNKVNPQSLFQQQSKMGVYSSMPNLNYGANNMNTMNYGWYGNNGSYNPQQMWQQQQMYWMQQQQMMKNGMNSNYQMYGSQKNLNGFNPVNNGVKKK